MFDHAQLRSFLILGQLRHFGQAARELLITQPALTRRIQQLESDVGVPLFHREGRRITLTAAGIAFLPKVQLLLADMEEARRSAQKAAGTLAGTITVGFDGAASYTLIPRLIQRTIRDWPGVAFKFVELSSSEQMREVAFHRLDIGFVRPLTHEADIVNQCMFSEPLALAVPAGHRLAAKRKLKIADLDDEAFVGYSEAGLYLRDLIAGMLDRAGAVPRVIQSMKRTHSILALVSTGMGVAIVPAGSASASFDNIVFKPLSLDERAEWHACRHVRPTNALTQPLIELLGDLSA
ncbi:hypothetical protein CG471_17985 [Sphingobium sp. IP1]|uniref:LysR family transcriptional regulator n=1 Tax=Sphingobium sp. IP1 TaxID=2021637 RepID=UPI000C0754F3|nr:LysR family transcriptional regulator [Sphingobium sp. IP1]PHP18378.1 hypothetical protein CG471_17985 [Sphingobium sp. IP1]